MSCRTGVRIGPDRGWAAACRALAALVISIGVLMALMRGAGTVMVVGGTRRCGASGPGGGAEANAIYHEREYRD